MGLYGSGRPWVKLLGPPLKDDLRVSELAANGFEGKQLNRFYLGRVGLVQQYEILPTFRKSRYDSAMLYFMLPRCSTNRP